MKKLFILFSTLALLASACQKSGMGGPGDDFSDAPWAKNTSLKVPITLGMEGLCDVKTDTKAPINSLTNVKFGVLAVDLNAPDPVNENEDWGELLRNKTAVLGSDGWAQFLTDTGTPITYFYPLESTHLYNYSFYAYRTTDATDPSDFAIEDNYTKDVELGVADVLWAKAEATEMPLYPGLTGFNADYMRKARTGYPNGTWQTYAPTLHFNHLTAALHFYVVAESEYAATTLSKVKIDSLVISNVYNNAKLDVITGDLTAVGEKGQMYMDNPAPVVPVYATELTDSIEMGKGFFILPTTDELTVNFKMTIPKQSSSEETVYYTYKRVQPYTISHGVEGFEAGKAYRFRIIVRSLEDIVIKLELEPWVWEEGYTDLEPVIGGLND